MADDTQSGVDDWTGAVHEGDAFDVLSAMPADSVHAVVTDPPYGLAFMGRDWDDFEPKEYQKWCEDWAAETKRVLKPGGHLLAFSGNRTHHRLFTGVEDAGYEIRDTITWHYGSGFPKASDISKTIDKRADAEREVVGEYVAPDGNGRHGGRLEGDYESEDYGEYKGDAITQTAPTTDAAKEWDGFKTGLKPATEYVVVARKPFDGATVDCVLEHGTGALNIDETRIENNIDEATTTTRTSERNQNAYGEAEQSDIASASPEGRYPSNVVFDETEADNVPSRYFYTSKASKSERTHDGDIENTHPTVKPLDLMEWLITLVTREDQTVLDPFTGSGTTPLAAKRLGREFIAIERQPKYVSLAQARIGLDIDDPSVIRDDAETGLDAFAGVER